MQLTWFSRAAWHLRFFYFFFLTTATSLFAWSQIVRVNDILFSWWWWSWIALFTTTTILLTFFLLTPLLLVRFSFALFTFLTFSPRFRFIIVVFSLLLIGIFFYFIPTNLWNRKNVYTLLTLAAILAKFSSESPDNSALPTSSRTSSSSSAK